MAKYFVQTGEHVDPTLEERAVRIAHEVGYDDAIGICYGVKPGETVASGYPNDVTAPKEDGEYTLFQIVTDNNCHGGFLWLK